MTNSSALEICAGREFRQEGESEGTTTHVKMDEDRTILEPRSISAHQRRQASPSEEHDKV